MLFEKGLPEGEGDRFLLRRCLGSGEAEEDSMSGMDEYVGRRGWAWTGTFIYDSAACLQQR